VNNRIVGNTAPKTLRRVVKEMILSSHEFLDKAHIEAALAREYRQKEN